MDVAGMVSLVHTCGFPADPRRRHALLSLGRRVTYSKKDLVWKYHHTAWKCRNFTKISMFTQLYIYP